MVCGQSMVTRSQHISCLSWCFYVVFACPDLRNLSESKASATNPAPSALAPNVWAKCRAAELCPCHVPAIICHICLHLPIPAVSVKCNCCKGCKVWRYFAKHLQGKHCLCWLRSDFLCVLAGRIMILLGWKQTFTKFKHDIRGDHGAIRKAIDSIGNSTGT